MSEATWVVVSGFLSLAGVVIGIRLLALWIYRIIEGFKNIR